MTIDKSKVAKMDMETFRQLKQAEDERDYWKRVAMGNPDDAEDYVRRLDEVNQEIAYEAFIERVKNPVTKCLMHDDAVNAAELIEMWRGVAETLHNAIVENAGAEGMDAYFWAQQEEGRIINSQSYQGNKK